MRDLLVIIALCLATVALAGLVQLLLRLPRALFWLANHQMPAAVIFFILVLCLGCVWALDERWPA